VIIEGKPGAANIYLPVCTGEINEEKIRWIDILFTIIKFVDGEYFLITILQVDLFRFFIGYWTTELDFYPAPVF
jgi:hypothetical protein